MSQQSIEQQDRHEVEERAAVKLPHAGPFRVTMVVRLFDPWVGGMERQAMKLASQLVDRGSDVEILTGRWFSSTRPTETAAGVTITRHHTLWNGSGLRGIRRIGAFAYMLTLAWHLWVRRKAHDVIHVHGLSYHAFVSSLVGRGTGTPVIVKLANSGPASDIVKMRDGKHLPLTRFMLPTALRADRFVALNDLVVSELQSAGVPSDRIIRIPNGVEVEEATRAYRRGTATKVLFVGRLHRQKAIDDLLEAVAGLTQKPIGREVELTLVGDGPERMALEALSLALGLAGHVHFVGEVDDVRPHLRQADVLVLPSRAEGLSNTLLEAMSTGLPVVASDIPANRALIQDAVNGLLYPVADVQALQGTLELIMGNESLRERLGCEGRRTVKSEYSIDRVAAQYESVYAELARITGEPR
jgi:glycosyltransferase involved in cell wall biosynthesis